MTFDGKPNSIKPKGDASGFIDMSNQAPPIYGCAGCKMQNIDPYHHRCSGKPIDSLVTKPAATCLDCGAVFSSGHICNKEPKYVEWWIDVYSNKNDFGYQSQRLKVKLQLAEIKA